MKKYKGYCYTTKKNNNNSYSWYIWSDIFDDKREVLQQSEEQLGTKTEAEIEAQESIDEYYE